MIVINFSHPLTAEQRAQIEALADLAIERVIDVPTQFDHGRPFGEQAAALVRAAGLSPEDWQILPLVVNLPSYSPGTAAVLARLHGLMGHFPAIVRLRPVEGAVPTRFEVAELLDLQTVRDRSREERDQCPG